MLPLIVSFYTRDWEYPQHAVRLARECVALGLDFRIDERPSAGGYLENCCLKPYFIRDMLKLGRPILWIDVDGSIIRRPVFFDGLDVDFAARKMAAGRARTWHVGTMFFRPTPAMIAFVDKWCELCGGLSDESALDALWNECQDITTSDIPQEYFQIARGRFYRPPTDTVIYHRISDGPSKQAQRQRWDKDKKQ